MKFENNENHISDFLFYIENVIKEKTKLINWYTYSVEEYRSKLTGYKWGTVVCKHCGFGQMSQLNHKKQTCRKCGEKYQRDISPSEKIKYEHNGILFFEE